MSKKDKTPEGGWLAPPVTKGLKPLAVANGTDRRGNWRWKEVPQTKKDRERRKEWKRRMEKADAKGKTFFKVPEV